jgi:cobalt/nickel transport system permease protein
MHIPDNLLSQPVVLTTGALAIGGFAFGLRKLNARLRDRTMVLMGVMSAFVFAAQMVNFPLFVVPASGHLIGGVLSAVLLGPWAGALVLGTVLIVQSLLFADGGILALGANFLNLGLIASVGGYAIYDPIRKAIGGQPGVLIGAMVAAWFSVLLASLAFTIELGASGYWSDLPRVLGWMTMIHAVIGLGEAIITGLVLRTVLSVRPDLIFDDDRATTRSGRWTRVAIGGLAASLAVAAFLAPLASPKDDGLEFVGGRLGFLGEDAGSILTGPMPDYSIEGLPDIAAVTAAVGLIGTLTVFVTGLILARAFTRKPQGLDDFDLPSPPDAGPKPHAA